MIEKLQVTISDGMTLLRKKSEDADPAAAATPRSIARRVGRGLRTGPSTLGHLADRVLHASRRETARRRIAEAPPIQNALFVCHGNICRSPFAAAVFARSMAARTHHRPQVTSAGFAEPRRLVPGSALAAAARRNIDLSAHRSRGITARALKTADLVVVMSADQAGALRRRFGPIRGTVLVLGDLDPDPIQRRTIVDPWGCDDAVFEASYSRIERCIGEMMRVLVRASRKPPARR